MQTLMLSLVRHRSGRLLLFMLAFAVAGVCFLPEIASIYWYWKHGSTTVYRGRTFPVPTGWISYQTPDGLVVQRLRRFYQRDGSMIIVVVPEEAESRRQVPAEWPSIAKRQIEAKGFLFDSEFESAIGTSRSVCLKFLNSESRDFVWVRCLTLAGDIQVDFKGDGELQRVLSFFMTNTKKNE